MAVVYCKGCSKPLCWNCSQQIFGGQNHVCSEACAKIAAQQPEPEDLPDSLFDRIYALVFLTLLLAGIGGGLCVWGGQSAIARQQSVRDFRVSRFEGLAGGIWHRSQYRSFYCGTLLYSRLA